MNILRLKYLPRQQYLLHLAFYTALAVTIYVLEGFLPKPLPFMKLGLSNAVVLALLITGNAGAALTVAIAKTVLGGLFSATLFSPTTLLSFSGTLLAFCLMLLAFKSRLNFSIIGVSIIGATAHNFAQIILVRFLLIKVASIFYLSPILILMGIVSGFITGYVAAIFVEVMKGSYERIDL